MSSALVEKLRSIPGGPMSADEAEFCENLRAVTKAVQDGRIPFSVAILCLNLDLREIRKHNLDLDAALASGFTPWVSTASRLHNLPSQLLTSSREQEFLTDLDGFLDFALRNGLTFLSVLAFIMHDVPMIANHEGDLEKAIAEESFRPKLDGWAKMNLESADDTGEPLE